MRNDALRVVSELAASQHDVFTRAQAAANGVSWRTIGALVESGLLAEPAPGVLVAVGGGEVTWRQRAIATARSRPGVALAFDTAARIAGIDGFDVHPSVDGPIALSVERPRVVRLPGVVVHRVASLPRCDLVSVDGAPCTNLARTLCDIGSVCDPLLVERALDDVVRRGSSRRWIRETALRLHRPGQRGTGVLLGALDALERRGVVRDSWFEKLIELCIDDPHLGEVTMQHRVRDERGRVVARFDLAIPEVMLGIEGHSREHHWGAGPEASDESRDDEVARLGWDVMYLGYASVQSPSTVLRRVQQRVDARRALLGIGSPSRGGAPRRATARSGAPLRGRSGRDGS